ncbi:unnamed protein product [Dovyalis caffra]|uniref:Uncharacterized protein n=1 Tax=Dovyalis caffra TaxID=77055 RepID=A0AAV1RYQ1_9ROSI|nr:unnamed protein product [Dovyalis caffra]
MNNLQRQAQGSHSTKKTEVKISHSMRCCVSQLAHHTVSLIFCNVPVTLLHQCRTKMLVVKDKIEPPRLWQYPAVIKNSGE